MKRLLIILAAAFMLAFCTLTACRDKSSPSAITIETPKGTDSFYIGEAIKLTKQSAELASSREFVAMYTADQEVAAQISSIADVNYDEPKSIKYIYINNDKILEFMRANAPEGEADLDYEKVIELNRFSVINFASIINSRYGAKMIAATTVLNNSRGYIQPEDFKGNFAVFLEYEGEFSSVVAYNQFGDNVISAQMTFVKNGDEHFEMLLEEIASSLGEESISVETVAREN